MYLFVWHSFHEHTFKASSRRLKIYLYLFTSLRRFLKKVLLALMEREYTCPSPCPVIAWPVELRSWRCRSFPCSQTRRVSRTKRLIVVSQWGGATTTAVYFFGVMIPSSWACKTEKMHRLKNKRRALSQWLGRMVYSAAVALSCWLVVLRNWISSLCFFSSTCRFSFSRFSMASHFALCSSSCFFSSALSVLRSAICKTPKTALWFKSWIVT